MKIIFWGSPEFTLNYVDLINKKYNLIALVTQPTKKKGRGKKEILPPLKVYGDKINIPVFQPENLNENFIAILKEYNPDLMIVTAYGKILSQDILNIPKYGVINVHYSLLPKYRGASPIPASILAGDKETGVTIIKLTSQMDAGPILGMKKEKIFPDDTSETLEKRLTQLGVNLLEEVIEKIKNGDIQEIPQDDSVATYCYTLKKEDGKIDWNKDAYYLERFIRAMIPWPKAYSTLIRKNKKERIIIYKASVIEDKKENFEPGQIIDVNEKGIQVSTSKNILNLIKIQKAGKKIMEVKDFIRGTKLSLEDRFI